MEDCAWSDFRPQQPESQTRALQFVCLLDSMHERYPMIQIFSPIDILVASSFKYF